jgi:hypothetical protein
MNDQEYAQWERGNIRGLSAKRKFVGTDRDPETGQQVNVYEFQDEDEWGNTLPQDEGFNQAHWRHQEFHRTVFDPSCRYCQESR